MTLRLIAKLLRDSRGIALQRITLMAIGVAMVVTCGLTAWSVQHAVGKTTERIASRQPDVIQAAGVTGFRVQVVADFIGTTPLTRVLVALPAGASPAQDWAPPGCAAFPSAGQSCVSPALAARVSSQPGLAARLHPGTAMTINAAGLATPDELLIYQDVPVAALTDATTADGWSGGGIAPPAAVSATVVLVELSLLVLLPAVIFLSVAARLSAATRARRMRSLRIIGMAPRQLAFVAAAEGRLAGFAGAGLGIGLYEALRAPLAGSGLAGFRWFTSDTHLGAWTISAIVAAAAAATGALCRQGATKATATPRAAARPASGWRIVPLWIGVLTLCGYIALHAVRPRLGGGTVAVVGGGALAALGLLLALRPLTEMIAGALAARARRPAIILGARRLRFEASSALRVLTALIVLMFSACIGDGALRDADLAAGPRQALTTVDVPASDVGSGAARDEVARLASAATAGGVTSTPTELAGQPLSADPGMAAIQLGVPIVYASCDSITRFQAVAVAGCHDGRSYRVQGAGVFPTQLPAGTTLTVPTATGEAPVTIPEPTLDVPGLGGLLTPDSILVTGPLAGGWPAEAAFSFLLPATDAALTRFQDNLATISPTAHAGLQALDPALLQAYGVHRQIILTGVTLGVVLASGAFILAVADRARERRRNVAALVAIGVPRRTIRAAQLVQLLVPACIALTAAAVIGCLIAEAYLSAGGLQHGLYLGTGRTAATLIVIGLTLAASSGLIIGRSRLRPADLRSE
ncbi:MAG TPA: FtsX-like permease family protein [Jatrophihabitantaceae bacterium]|jgi:hypothetical protein|nr:FtsX-like permease family protein [Jatrophihabitantaceae bacterium]